MAAPTQETTPTDDEVLRQLAEASHTGQPTPEEVSRGIGQVGLLDDERILGGPVSAD